jgi:nijmegen breakage syndrome protein 1
VVASKRNTSKGLQALINGKYIVDNTFIDAIVAAVHSEGDEISPLEIDFDLNWPDALKHLPPRGQEPTERRANAYSPNPARQEIFDGYTFVFCDQSQFENLLAPITNGRGKALLRQIDPKITQVEDFIRYVKHVAGEKGLGEFEDGSEGKGVVVVKYQPAKGPTSEWYKDFSRRVAIRLDHRLIEQSEFLDAILNNDASVLRKPLEIEPSGSVALPLTAGGRS